MHTLFQDLRYALRTLRKNFLLTAVIVASLAIGIGANSAIFSVVDALLLRPLPYPHPDRLAAVWLDSPAIGILRDWPSPAAKAAPSPSASASSAENNQEPIPAEFFAVAQHAAPSLAHIYLSNLSAAVLVWCASTRGKNAAGAWPHSRNTM